MGNSNQHTSAGQCKHTKSKRHRQRLSRARPLHALSNLDRSGWACIGQRCACCCGSLEHVSSARPARGILILCLNLVPRNE
jgi:hypothetical protein